MLPLRLPLPLLQVDGEHPRLVRVAAAVVGPPHPRLLHHPGGWVNGLLLLLPLLLLLLLQHLLPACLLPACPNALIF